MLMVTSRRFCDLVLGGRRAFALPNSWVVVFGCGVLTDGVSQAAQLMAAVLR